MVSLFGMTETTGILTHGQSLSVWRHVDDEGAAIAMTIHLSKACLQLPFQCWDVEDGHVLLIEAALQLKRMFTTAVSMLGCGGWTCPVDRSGSSATGVGGLYFTCFV